MATDGRASVRHRCGQTIASLWRGAVVRQAVEHGGDARQALHIRRDLPADLQLVVCVAVGADHLLKRLRKPVAHTLGLVSGGDGVHQAHRVARVQAPRQRDAESIASKSKPARSGTAGCGAVPPMFAFIPAQKLTPCSFSNASSAARSRSAGRSWRPVDSAPRARRQPCARRSHPRNARRPCSLPP